MLNTAPIFFKMGCLAKSGFQVFQMGFGPSTFGARANTRLHTPKAVTYHGQPRYCRFVIGHSLGRMESRIKKITPHYIFRHPSYRALSYHILYFQAPRHITHP